MKLSENAYGILYYTEQLKAAQSYLQDTPDYFYRKVCRWYSAKFHTPLTEVYELPYDFLLQHYYESQFDNRSFNEVFDVAKKMLKEFVDQDELDNKAFAEELLKEQAETIARKQAKQKASEKKSDVKVPEFNIQFNEEETEKE